jgi:hypothetical protein
LKNHRAKWDFFNNKISVDGVVYKLFSKREDAWYRRIVVAADATVPARSESVLMTNLVYQDMSAFQGVGDCEWMTEINEPIRGLHVLHTLIPVDARQIPITVMNSTSSPITLKAQTVVTDVNPVRSISSSNEADSGNEKYDDIINDLVSRVATEISHDGLERLRTLLMDYKQTFLTGDNDLGSTTVVSQGIQTGKAKPVRQALRRYPPAPLEAIHQQMTSMLEQGVIEPAQSAWASNVVLVKKKDNSLRYCFDYRQLNAVTEKVAYPLPRTDMCLDAMTWAQWFSTFDLRSSYHQVPLVPEDADKTAFICRDGMFRFIKLPFGLCNAGATFQRLMDIILSGL